jgi:cellulose synthase/poly-beta-1,6-N-acetylglucosamine synthase-like glycosyltransferase
MPGCWRNAANRAISYCGNPSREICKKGPALIFIEIIYVISAALLAMYGYNSLLLAYLRSKRTKPVERKSVPQDYPWPHVTVQLPLYNERYVAQRLIETISAFDYPKDRLHIQVLDDSNDDTVDIIRQAVKEQRHKGIDIEHTLRPDRTGFKGGALEFGLGHAKGEFIAIFDADFMPDPSYLKEIMPYFADDPKIGCLQARWGHLNEESSWMTRAQANGINGHFIVEQGVRSASDMFLNFNGTAGVWRKTCIQEAGGWHHDTLTEDLDLSYRAQLKGWKIRFVPHVIAPAELPVHISALKRQQFRWAKGSIQTARKLLGELWRSSQPMHVKVEGSIHLTNYIVHPLILINLFLTLPLVSSQSPLLWLTPIFALAAFGPLSMYWVAMRSDGKRVIERITNLAMLVVLGMGLSINNSRAVLEALAGKQSSFLRTPKFNVTGNTTAVRSSEYLLPRDPSVWIEIVLALYASALLVYVLVQGVWSMVIWLLLYACGYIMIASQNFRGGIAASGQYNKD